MLLAKGSTIIHQGQGIFPNPNLANFGQEHFYSDQIWPVATNGDAASSHISDETGHFGIGRMTWTNGIGDYNTPGAITISGARWKCTMMVRLNTLSDGTNDYTYEAGLSDSLFTSNASTIMLRYRHSSNSGRWIGVTNDGSESTVNGPAGAAIVAGTWYELGMECNAASSLVHFTANGVIVGDITTHIPTAAMNPRVRVTRNAGTASRTVDIDYFYWERG